MNTFRRFTYFALGYTVFVGFCLTVVAYRLAAPTHAQKLLEQVRPSLVTLRNPSNLQSGGTGFAVKGASGTTYTLTNAHICEMTQGDYIVAKNGPADNRGTRVFPLEITHETDLCIATAVPGLQPLEVADTVNISKQHVYIVGYPLLNPLSVSEGNLAGLEYLTLEYCENKLISGNGYMLLPAMPGSNRDPLDGMYEVDERECVRSLWAAMSTARSFPGNSGSPTLDEDGKIVGVLFGGSGRGVSASVPLSEVKKFLSRY